MPNSEPMRGTSSTTNEGDENYESEETTRLQARQMLGVMVERLARFFEEIRPESSSNNRNILQEHLYKMYMLPRLGLHLTDLLIKQLTNTRSALERSYTEFDANLIARRPLQQQTRNNLETSRTSVGTNTTPVNDEPTLAATTHSQTDSTITNPTNTAVTHTGLLP